MRVMRYSSSALVALVSALNKQTPVADVPDIWVLFFLRVCERTCVCVCVLLLGLPLAKPSLLHLHFLRSPSSRFLGLRRWKDWWAAWLPSVLPDILTNSGRRGRARGARSVRHHSFLPHLESIKKPWGTEGDKESNKFVQAGNRAPVVGRWHHLHGYLNSCYKPVFWDHPFCPC